VAFQSILWHLWHFKVFCGICGISKYFAAFEAFQSILRHLLHFAESVAIAAFPSILLHFSICGIRSTYV
jgi:hypothetical protein